MDNQQEEQPIVELTINDKTYKLLIADHPHAWQQGLMHYRELTQADGMIFVFPIKDYHSFWNQNTFMDLDIYWVSDHTVVGTAFLPSIEKSKEIVSVASPEPVEWVIEIVRKE